MWQRRAKSLRAGDRPSPAEQLQMESVAVTILHIVTSSKLSPDLETEDVVPRSSTWLTYIKYSCICSSPILQEINFHQVPDTG